MGWTRAFHNTRYSYTVVYSGQEWQSEFVGKSLEHLADMNQSATDQSLL